MNAAELALILGMGGVGIGLGAVTGGILALTLVRRIERRERERRVRAAAALAKLRLIQEWVKR